MPIYSVDNHSKIQFSRVGSSVIVVSHFLMLSLPVKKNNIMYTAFRLDDIGGSLYAN